MLTINATKRTTKQNDALRASGFVPAVVYAPGLDSMSLSISAKEFNMAYREAGDSTLVSLQIEGEKDPLTVLIQDVHMAPVKDEVLHVDFYKVTEGQELTATISFNFIGEAPGVKLGGTLMIQRDDISVTCMPKDLVDHIDVDLSVLANPGDAIHLSDIAMPAGITPEDEDSLVIVSVAVPKEETEDGEVRTIDDIAVDKKGKVEDAEKDA
jgi:large subunit ribosomal protein L25